MLAQFAQNFRIGMLLVCVGIAIFACANSAKADYWQDVEAQRDAENARRVEQNHANLRLFARTLSFAAAGVLGWLAVSVARHGLGFGAQLRRIRGSRAWIGAAILGAACVSFTVIGLRYPETFIPAKEKPLPTPRSQ